MTAQPSPEPLTRLDRGRALLNARHRTLAAETLRTKAAPEGEPLADDGFWAALAEALIAPLSDLVTDADEHRANRMLIAVGDHPMAAWIYVDYLRAGCALSVKGLNRHLSRYRHPDPDLLAPIRHWLRQPKHPSQPVLTHALARQSTLDDLDLLIALATPGRHNSVRTNRAALDGLQRHRAAGAHALLDAAPSLRDPASFLRCVAEIRVRQAEEAQAIVARLQGWDLAQAAAREALSGFTAENRRLLSAQP